MPMNFAPLFAPPLRAKASNVIGLLSRLLHPSPIPSCTPVVGSEHGRDLGPSLSSYESALRGLSGPISGFLHAPFDPCRAKGWLIDQFHHLVAIGLAEIELATTEKPGNAGLFYYRYALMIRTSQTTCSAHPLILRAIWASLTRGARPGACAPGLSQQESVARSALMGSRLLSGHKKAQLRLCCQRGLPLLRVSSGENPADDMARANRSSFAHLPQ